MFYHTSNNWLFRFRVADQRAHRALFTQRSKGQNASWSRYVSTRTKKSLLAKFFIDFLDVILTFSPFDYHDLSRASSTLTSTLLVSRFLTVFFRPVLIFTLSSSFPLLVWRTVWFPISFMCSEQSGVISQLIGPVRHFSPLRFIFRFTILFLNDCIYISYYNGSDAEYFVVLKEPANDFLPMKLEVFDISE